MPHLESKTKLIMTVSVNKYINPKKTTLRLLFSYNISHKFRDGNNATHNNLNNVI